MAFEPSVPVLSGFLAALSGSRSGSFPAAATAVRRVNPGINDEFLKPDLNPCNWVESFEKEGHQVFDHRREIVAAAGLKSGHRLADPGAGTGLFTYLFADAVGSHRQVYAVNISPPLLAHLKSRTAEAQGQLCFPLPLSPPQTTGNFRRKFRKLVARESSS